MSEPTKDTHAREEADKEYTQAELDREGEDGHWPPQEETSEEGCRNPQEEEPIPGSSEWCEVSEDHRHCDCWWNGGAACCVCGVVNGATEEQ